MRRLLVPLIAVVALLVTPAAALGAVGDLVQKATPNGCISDNGTDGVNLDVVCVDGTHIVEPSHIVVSPDGKNVYASLDEGDGVAEFRRNDDGSLTQIGCISETVVVGCANGRAMDQILSLAITPDGEHLYGAVNNQDAVVVLNRDPATGLLSQDPTDAGCISNSGNPTCVDGRGMNAAEDVAVSPDGAQVYVSARLDDSVAVLDRTASTGKLTQDPLAPGCIADDGGLLTCVDGDFLQAPAAIAISPDGGSLYVGATDDDAVTALDRAPGGDLSLDGGPEPCVSDVTAGCKDGRGLLDVTDLVVTSDGNSLYSTDSGDFVGIFDRVAGGDITQKNGPPGCLSNEDTDLGCTLGHGINQVLHVAASPDGRSVYTGAGVSLSMALFDRDPGTGALTQKPAPLACLNLIADNGCGPGIGLKEAAIAVSPDSKSVYTAEEDNQGVIGVFDREPVPGPDPEPPAAEVECDGKTATIVGTDDGEKLKGTKKADVIAALGGKDKVVAGAGNDRVCGGDGNDNLNGSKGKDRLFGEAGKDKLNGSGGKGDLCNGGAGKDKAQGSCEKERSA